MESKPYNFLSQLAIWLVLASFLTGKGLADNSKAEESPPSGEEHSALTFKRSRATLRIIEEIEKSMVRIPAGEAVIGSNDGAPFEKPEHRVYVSEFYISRYEITNRQYFQFARYQQEYKSFFADDIYLNQQGHPVVGVSWHDANMFCLWLSRLSNKKFRLPTEAEWEKAATWNPDQKIRRKYAWGDRFSPAAANLLGKEDGYEFIAPAGAFPSGVSSYGIFSMSGNVQEWCADWYAEDYYQSSPHKDPAGPETGAAKVVRGGSFHKSPKQAFGYIRYSMIPGNKANYFGFRIVRSR
ncbi:MAG: formylglycine-generating enzyme family protein [bacterium]